MPGPALTLGFIVATLLGTTFHMVVGGDARRLALFLLSGWIGFALGQLFGQMFGVSILRIGQLYFFSAVLGGLVALVVAFVLTRRERRKREWVSRGR